MEYLLLLADTITGQPWLPDGTPQRLERGVLPFRQRIPDKESAFALKDEYLAKYLRAQVEIQSTDGAEKWMFQNPIESIMESLATQVDGIVPGAGSAFRDLPPP